MFPISFKIRNKRNDRKRLSARLFMEYIDKRFG